MDIHTRSIESPVTDPLTYLDLFAGVSMLGLGFECGLNHLGREARCLAHVEIEAYAVQVLVARMQDGSLPATPIYTDVRTFDGTVLRGKCDAVIGGSPCTDLSIAGKRLGITGERSGLWEEFRRIVGEVEPRIVFFENVDGIASSLTLAHRSEITGWLNRVLAAAEDARKDGDYRSAYYLTGHHGRLHRRLLKQYGIPALLYVQCGLEALGYRCETGFFSAAEVGAPHKRKRVFIWAERGERRDREERGCGLLAECEGGGRGELRESSRGEGFANRSGEGVEDSSRQLADARSGLLPVSGRGPGRRAGVGPAGEGDGTELPSELFGELPSLDDSAGTRPNGRESGSDRALRDEARGEESRGRCDCLAESECSRRQTARIGCDIDTGGEPQAGCGVLGDPSLMGLEGRPGIGSDDGEECETTERTSADLACECECGRTSPLFPPGPNDRLAWLSMPPHLAPAIKPGFRLNTHESAILLDASRTDQLRALGNGVVALCASYALVTLARRFEDRGSGDDRGRDRDQDGVSLDGHMRTSADLHTPVTSDSDLHLQ